MGFTFGNRRVVSKDAHHPQAAGVDGNGAGEVVADPVVIPSKQTSLPPQSPKPIGRTSSSLFPWRKSKRQERNPEVSEAEARAVLASKRQEPPFEIRIPSTPHRSPRASEAPYSVVPAASSPSSAAQPASRRIGSDIPIHALPVVMTEKELNPCLAGSDDEEDTTTNPSCTDLDLSSTTEEGFETLGGKDEDEVMGRAGTPVVWEMEEGDNPRLPRVPIVHVKVSAPSPQRNARRSQSPLRMMVTPKESSTPTTPLSPPLTFSQAAAAASAASTTSAVVTPPSHQARAPHPPRMSSSPSPSIGHSRFHAPPPPNSRTSGPDREGTPLPFDQPERFMELTHAVRRMLVATCEQDTDVGPDNNAATATTGTASSTPIAKNTRPSHASHQYEQQRGPTASAFGLGLNGIQGYMPAYWDAPCGAGAYRPTEQPQQQQPPQPPTPAQSAASCHPVLMGEVWQRQQPMASNRISPAATASLLCRPPPGIGSWTCGTMSPADGRPCVTGVLSVDDMDSDSLVDEEDRHQPPKPKAETTAPNGAADEIQDPEEEPVARSSGPSKSDPAPLKAELDHTSTVVKAPARGNVASASPVAAAKHAPEAEARERSSSPRCTPPASTLAPDDHPDDERVASTAAKALPKSPTKQPRSLILQSSRVSSRSSSAPPSPGRVRFDDNPQEVRYLKSDEDEHTITCASLVENSVTDPSEVDDDDDDDLYDDDDDLYDDSDDVESMDSAEYVEFLRHRKERRFDDCSASAAEQSGCSEHYAEYQKHRRKRRLDRGLKGDGSSSTGGGGCNGDGGEFSLTQELSDLFNDCTYLFRFFNDQYLGIGGTDGGGKSSPRRRKGRRRRRSSPSSEKGSSSKSAGATVKVRRASVNEDGTVTQAAAIVA